MFFGRRYFEKEFRCEDPWQVCGSELQRTKYTRQTDALRSLVPKAASILEIGCAEGAHTVMLADAFPHSRIVAVDISTSATARARRRCHGRPNVEFLDGDIDGLLKDRSLPSPPYDAVLQSESLYYMFTGHLLHWRLFGYVRDLMASVSPGGVFLTCNSYAGVTRPVMSAYYGALARVAVPVLAETYREWFDSKQSYWTYEMRAYRTRRRSQDESAGFQAARTRAETASRGE